MRERVSYTERVTRPARTIASLIDAYLVELGSGTAQTAAPGGVEGSLSLLRDALEGYGYQYLSRTEAASDTTSERPHVRDPEHERHAGEAARCSATVGESMPWVIGR